MKVISERWTGGRSDMRGRQLVRGLVIRLGTQICFPFFVSERVQEIGDGGDRSQRSGFDDGALYGG